MEDLLWAKHGATCFLRIFACSSAYKAVELFPVSRYKNRDLVRVQDSLWSKSLGLTRRGIRPLLDSRPRLLVILLCCSDTVAANLHMAVWVSEHKLALCCRSSPVGTYTHHWNQPWPYYQKWHIRCHSSLLRRSSRHGNPQGAFVQNSSTGTAGSSSDQQILLDMLN